MLGSVQRRAETRVAIALAVACLLLSHDSGRRSGSAANAQDLGPDPTASPLFAGRAIYTSALVGCTVFADVNLDGLLDPGEPSTVSLDNGVFLLDLQGQSLDAPIVVATGENSPTLCLDSATGRSPGIQLIAAAGCRVISPVSTLAYKLTEGAHSLTMPDSGEFFLAVNLRGCHWKMQKPSSHDQAQWQS